MSIAVDDINTLRSVVTVLAFGVFVGIVMWVWQPRRAESFRRAACLPLADDGADCAGLVSDTRQNRHERPSI